MEERYRTVIAHEFEDCIKRTIIRLENEETHRPFHSALLSPEALFWSRFERSFSTSFGQRVVEKISKVAALAGGATDAETQKLSSFELPRNQLAAIENHIGHLRGNTLGRPREWGADLAAVGTQRGGELERVRVISDLWWVKDGINHYMSIKTVKPNLDQTAEAKRDLLKLQLSDPNCRVYFGLYYNPFGELRENYSWALPMRIFDFRNDPVILVGRDYWDTLGGNGFYEEVLAIADECGTRTRKIVGNLNL
jgi:hypothetical protein